MKIAWISPLGTSMLRSACFSRSVLPQLAKQHTTEVFVGDIGHLPAEESADGEPWQTYHVTRLGERIRKVDFNLMVFLLEDHLSCNFTRLAAECWPGLVIAFDVNLFSLQLERLKHTTAPTEVDALFGSQRSQESEDSTASHPDFGDYHIRSWSLDLYRSRFPLHISPPQAFRHFAVFSETARQRLAKRDESEAEVLLISQFPPLLPPGQRTEVSSPVTDAPESQLSLCFDGSLRFSHRVQLILSSLSHLHESDVSYAAKWICYSTAEAVEAKRELLDEFPELQNSVCVQTIGSESALLSLSAQCNLCISLCRDPDAYPRPLAIAAKMVDRYLLLTEGTPAATDHFYGKLSRLPLGFGEEEMLTAFLMKFSSKLLSLPDPMQSFKGLGAAEGNNAAKFSDSFISMLERKELEMKEPIRTELLRKQSLQEELVESCINELQQFVAELSPASNETADPDEGHWPLDTLSVDLAELRRIF